MRHVGWVQAAINAAIQSVLPATGGQELRWGVAAWPGMLVFPDWRELRPWVTFCVHVGSAQYRFCVRGQDAVVRDEAGCFETAGQPTGSLC